MPDVSALAQEETAAGAAASTPGKRRLPLLVISIGAAVLILGIGAALMLTHAFGGSTAAHKKAPAAHAPAGPPLYLALDPPFVVNFQADQLVRFLQVSVEVMSRDQKTLDLLKSNDPVLRNDLLILFANQKYTVLSTPEGKEQLRAQALTAIRKDLVQAGGDPKLVEAVYFTSFVMQ
ncbi:MAG TPA: flagellar basal body-associated FliL family protein [Steroidobacteraceae bacterium]|nr:flagellar basal body-associated FliL family protein [Steroidobacteraceae bacterium]